MKKRDKFKVIMRYEYIDISHIKRMLYIVFSIKGTLFYIQDDYEVLTKIDDEDQSIDEISQTKYDYVKYNSKPLNMSNFNSMIQLLESMNANLNYDIIKKIKRQLKLSELL